MISDQVANAIAQQCRGIAMCDNAVEERRMRAEVYWRMGQTATERFNRRQSFEWKMNIALWTPLATATAWLLTNRPQQQFGPGVCLTATIVVMLILFVYIFLWRIRLQTINCLERQKIVYWHNKYIRSVGLEKEDLDLNNLLPAWAKDGLKVLGFDDDMLSWPPADTWNWSVTYQVSITGILSLGLLAIVWAPYVEDIMEKGMEDMEMRILLLILGVMLIVFSGLLHFATDTKETDRRANQRDVNFDRLLRLKCKDNAKDKDNDDNAKTYLCRYCGGSGRTTTKLIFHKDCPKCNGLGLGLDSDIVSKEAAENQVVRRERDDR